MTKLPVVVLLCACAMQVYTVTACCTDKDLALLTALKGMKECKKAFLINLIKPQLECAKPCLPLMPKLPKCWGKAYDKCSVPPYSPLVFLLPSPGALPPSYSPLTSMPALSLPQAPVQYLPPTFLPPLPSPPPVTSALPPLPPAPTCPAPKFPVYLPQPPPPPTCQCNAPAPPLQQVYYLPPQAPTCAKQSPLLYLSKQ